MFWTNRSLRLDSLSLVDSLDTFNYLCARYILMADQHSDDGVGKPNASIDSLDSKGVTDPPSDEHVSTASVSAGSSESPHVANQDANEGVSVADVALESLKSKDAADKHLKGLSTDHAAVRRAESSGVTDQQHSDEGVTIADVALESLTSKDIADKNIDEGAVRDHVAVTSPKSTSVTDEHSDEGASIADVALESLNSKNVADKSISESAITDHVSVTDVSDPHSDEGVSVADVALDSLKSKGVADKQSEEGAITESVISLESTGVADQHSDEGASIADVALESLKSKDSADKHLDIGETKTNANIDKSELKGSGSTLEINVKTLDSQLHNFEVDKNMLVSVFKEKIASEVDLPVEQQRLIFRGKVLKDEDHLSEYHVENGHTLHLVARQPSEFQSSAGSPNADATARSNNTGLFRIPSHHYSTTIGTILNVRAPIPLTISSTSNLVDIIPIPDSLYTISEFMDRMERALSQNGYQPSNSTEGALAPAELPTNARGLLSPAALAVVLRHAQRLLIGPTIDSLSHTARRLEEEVGCTDVNVRTEIHTEAMQSGLAMQHLGALLLELGRTMLTLRIGQSHVESFVNAGPAIYISSSGPNPIMAQPFPLQTNSLFGDHHASPTMNPMAFNPMGVGAVPRHLNIHIHAGVGPRTTNVESNQGELTNRTGNVTPAFSLEVGDNTISGNQAFSDLPEVRTDAGGMGNATSSTTRMKPLSEADGGASSSRRSNAPIPLGLGPGGLQPQRQPQQTRSEAGSGSASTSVGNQSLTSPGGQMDPATMMNQVMQNPALSSLLAAAANQPGAGPPDVLRNLMSQLAQNPAMMNTVTQLAQQMDGNQNLASMMAGMGGPGSGSGDMSSMVQQMMPFVSQSLNRGSSSSNLLQRQPSRKPTLHRRHSSVKNLNINERSSSDFRMNLENAAQKIVEQYPPTEIFSSIVETAALHNSIFDSGALDELCMEEELAQRVLDSLIVSSKLLVFQWLLQMTFLSRVLISFLCLHDRVSSSRLKEFAVVPLKRDRLPSVLTLIESILPFAVEYCGDCIKTSLVAVSGK
ncbi:ubiquitin-like domain-containing protein CIP73 isoform X3 [Tanacetum coccineum]